MSSKPLFEENFNNLREQWEKSLLSELKLTEIGNKASKKFLNGTSWPTLSLEAKSTVRLSPEVSWKKASTSHGYLSSGEAEAVLKDDLSNGVRNFFFFTDYLSDDTWNVIDKTFSAFSKKEELEVFLLGLKKHSSSAYKVIPDFYSGWTAVMAGGESVQELAVMTNELVKSQKFDQEVYVGVFVDSHFFQNIAKIRAARLLATKVLQETGSSAKVKIVALTDFSGWTLFERYSNMLRNETAVASAYIGGADHVQSSGYNAIVELETINPEVSEHTERSRRMCRNTTHILALESMLGVVEDAAFGSYHLESLTEYFCEEAWKLMQKLAAGSDLSVEIAKVREQRSQMLKTRKSVMSGTNDYPDMKEKMNVKLKAVPFFRVAREFEELRLQMEAMKAPSVYIALYGDYGALNARLNFVKNYFELLGLNVSEPGHSVTDVNEFSRDLSNRKEEIIVLCAADDQYPVITEAASKTKAQFTFIAGKYELAGFKNLFAGQNVYEILHNLVQDLKGGKA